MASPNHDIKALQCCDGAINHPYPSLFVVDEDDEINASEDKLGSYIEGNYTFQMCKHAPPIDQADIETVDKMGNKKVIPGNRRRAVTLHSRGIVVSVAGVLPDGGLDGPRASAGVHFGNFNLSNGGAIINPKAHDDETPTIELVYLLGLKEALMRSKITASTLSFLYDAPGFNPRRPIDNVGIDYERFSTLIGLPPMKVTVKDKTYYFEDDDRNLGPEPLKAMSKRLNKIETGYGHGILPEEAYIRCMFPKVKKLERIIIRTDSDYLANDVFPNIEKWSQRGWKTCRGRPIKYKREMEAIWSWIADLRSFGVDVVFWKVSRDTIKEAVYMAKRGSILEILDHKKPVVQWTQPLE